MSGPTSIIFGVEFGLPNRWSLHKYKANPLKFVAVIIKSREIWVRLYKAVTQMHVPMSTFFGVSVCFWHLIPRGKYKKN